MIINDNEVKHLFLKGQQFDINHDNLIGKTMKIDNYGFGNGNNIKIRMDGSTDFDYPYNNALPSQTVKIDGYRFGNNTDPMFPSLWLSGKICTYKFNTASKYDVWVKASDVTVLQNGGVNSTPIFMFIYCMEVMPS